MRMKPMTPKGSGMGGNKYGGAWGLRVKVETGSKPVYTAVRLPDLLPSHMHSGNCWGQETLNERLQTQRYQAERRAAIRHRV